MKDAQIIVYNFLLYFHTFIHHLHYWPRWDNNDFYIALLKFSRVATVHMCTFVEVTHLRHVNYLNV